MTLWIMLNDSFENGTATIYQIQYTSNGIEFCEDAVALHADIPVQICGCATGESDRMSCWPVDDFTKSMVIRIKPTYTFPSDMRRNKYEFDLSDCLGFMGRFKVEDIVCVELPSSWLYAYKIVWYIKETA